MSQISLWTDRTKEQSFIPDVSIDSVEISPLNPRKRRADGHIESIAKLIVTNGFDTTCAPKAIRVNGHYEVFAGGNRLMAAKKAGCASIPLYLYDGFSEDEIWRLAYLDNDQAGKHNAVGIVDVWQDYLERSKTKTQKDIASALGISQTLVSFRIACAQFPKKIIDCFITRDFLNERHAREIISLLPGNNLFPWLDRESLMLEIVTGTIDKHKKAVTAKHFAEAITPINEMISYAVTVIESLGIVTLHDGDKTQAWDTRNYLLTELANKKARTVSAVTNMEHVINKKIAADSRAHQIYSSEQAAEAERIALASQPLEVVVGDWWKLGRHLLYCGDTSKPEFYEKVSNAAFAFADPPYNAETGDWDKDFVWQHDWLIDKAPIVTVTPGIASLQSFLRNTTMPYVWSMPVLIDNGMTRSPVGFGNWICITLFATMSIHRNAQDYIKASVVSDGETGRFSGFKGRKPPEAITKLLELFTKRDEIVIDPFLGSGTTLFIAEENQRRCIGGEIDPDRCRLILEEWQDRTGIRPEKIDG